MKDRTAGRGRRLAPEGAQPAPAMFHFERQDLHLLPRLECSGRIMAHCSLDLSDLSDPPITVPQVAGKRGMHHHI
ncbi:putative uncharacterized protein CCDC28A-AS1, partial [Plecturocebus cupreus]